MHFLRVIRGNPGAYELIITCPQNIKTIGENINQDIWNYKLIGNTLFLDIKINPSTKRFLDKSNCRSRGIETLGNFKKEVIKAANSLAYDTEWTSLISIFDLLHNLRYIFVFQDNEGGMFFRYLPHPNINRQLPISPYQK